MLIPSVGHVSDGRKNVGYRIDYLRRLQGRITSHTARDKDGPAWHQCGRVARPIFFHGIGNGPSLGAWIVGFVRSEKPTLKRGATDGQDPAIREQDRPVVGPVKEHRCPGDKSLGRGIIDFYLVVR